MPNSDIKVIWTPIIKWFVVTCGSTNGRQEDMCLNRDWITCSKYANECGHR